MTAADSWFLIHPKDAEKKKNLEWLVMLSYYSTINVIIGDIISISGQWQQMSQTLKKCSSYIYSYIHQLSRQLGARTSAMLGDAFLLH